MENYRTASERLRLWVIIILMIWCIVYIDMQYYTLLPILMPVSDRHRSHFRPSSSSDLSLLFAIFWVSWPFKFDTRQTDVKRTNIEFIQIRTFFLESSVLYSFKFILQSYWKCSLQIYCEFTCQNHAEITVRDDGRSGWSRRRFASSRCDVLPPGVYVNDSIHWQLINFCY